jgi:hypothetical protein
MSQVVQSPHTIPALEVHRTAVRVQLCCAVLHLTRELYLFGQIKQSASLKAFSR